MSILVRSTPSGKLERWLGAESVEHLSRQMKGWYGPPIAIAGVPGSVWACGDGDFRGPIKAGRLCPAIDYAESRIKKILRNASRRQLNSLNMGFSSISDLIQEAANGKRQVFPFNKAGASGVTAGNSSLWSVGNQPAAGAGTSGAAPSGTVPTSASAGAFGFTNPSSGDTQHFVGATVTATLAQTLMLYDRLFEVTKTMNSTATEAVSGVPTRYTSQTATAADYIGGNFIFIEVGGTALAATAHTWSICLYSDQGGASSTMPDLVGVSGANVRRFDHPVNTWFAPLASGDVGVTSVTQMQCNASVATGVANFVVGHPIAWMPIPLINVLCIIDGINSAFNLVRIFDNAALGLLEIVRNINTATTYTGQFETVSG